MTNARETSIADLEQRARSAYLKGADEETESLWIHAHNECVANGDPSRAARCIFWLVLDLFNRREWARGSGWLARGMHLVESANDDPALGLLLILATRDHLRQGAVDAAAEAVERAGAIARRTHDRDLDVLYRMSRALVHMRRGEHARATSLFDEIMVGVTVDRVSPVVVGVVYCAVIEACRSLFDLARAREWTSALDKWCASQPQGIAFRGKCLVHRTEILRFSGDWSQALIEAERACEWTGAHDNSFRYPSGPAFYELAELHRLRGHVDAAEAAYRRASELGQSPEPGLTLMMFAEGRRDLAVAAIRRLVAERQGLVQRSEILLAAVEILVAIDDSASARASADELSRMSAQAQSPALRAMAAHANGAVWLREGDLAQALGSLRDAWMLWQELEVPYQAARVRVLIGQACQRLGDSVAADFEFEGARQFFQRVSAQPDLARLAALRAMQSPEGQALSPRERQVIELIATGRTNREIAHTLSISERTVDRHVSNILLKLHLPSRSAATAYAYQHDLIARSG